MGSLRKEDWPHQCRWVSSNLLRTKNRTKNGERGDSLSLLELRHPSSPVLGHQSSSFSVIWTQTRSYTISPPILWPSDSKGRSWDCLASITAGDNFSNKSPLIYISIYPIDPLSLENVNTISIVKYVKIASTGGDSITERKISSEP